MGDTSDNIPGVPGIGEKTAAKIIKEYHSIENAHEHIEEIKPARAKNNLQEYYEQAIMSKDLATIKKTAIFLMILKMQRLEHFLQRMHTSYLKSWN